MQRSSIRFGLSQTVTALGVSLARTHECLGQQWRGLGHAFCPDCTKCFFLPLMTAAESRDLVEDLQLLARHYAERLNLLRTCWKEAEAVANGQILDYSLCFKLLCSLLWMMQGFVH